MSSILWASQGKLYQERGAKFEDAIGNVLSKLNLPGYTRHPRGKNKFPDFSFYNDGRVFPSIEKGKLIWLELKTGRLVFSNINNPNIIKAIVFKSKMDESSADYYAISHFFNNDFKDEEDKKKNIPIVVRILNENKKSFLELMNIIPKIGATLVIAGKKEEKPVFNLVNSKELASKETFKQEGNFIVFGGFLTLRRYNKTSWSLLARRDFKKYKKEIASNIVILEDLEITIFNFMKELLEDV